MWNICTNSWICATGENTIAYSLGWEKSLCYNYFIIILCTNYLIYNKEASVCVVKRRLLFCNIYPHFLISTLALWGKDIGKWETGHTAGSHKEKLNAIFPYLWTVFKLYHCRTEERASNTYKARSSSCAAVRWAGRLQKLCEQLPAWACCHPSDLPEPDIFR